MKRESIGRAALIEQTAGRLERAGLTFGHGTDNAFDEAAWLVMHALGLSPAGPLEEPERAVTAEEQSRVADLLARRVDTRQPLAYLLNSAWFCGLEFYVDERVIVPRSPVAELIAGRFRPWLPEPPGSILDLCCGSGCIGIACALMFPGARVDATDIDEGALAVARINRDRHLPAERLGLWRADLFDGLPKRRYDLIVSNPPYVDAPEMAHLPDEYRHEPALALAAGDDGLDRVRRILSGAADYLSERGTLIVEVGNSAGALMRAFPRLPFIWPEFEYGGEGVFVLSARDLREHAGDIA